MLSSAETTPPPTLESGIRGELERLASNHDNLTVGFVISVSQDGYQGLTGSTNGDLLRERGADMGSDQHNLWNNIHKVEIYLVLFILDRPFFIQIGLIRILFLLNHKSVA